MAIVAVWAIHATRRGRPASAAVVALAIAFVGAAVGGAATAVLRDPKIVHSFNNNTAVIIGYVIVGGTVAFAAVRAATPEARASAFLLGLVAGVLCGWLRIAFGSHPPTAAELAEVGLQGLAIAGAATLAVVLSRATQSRTSRAAVAGT